MKPFECPSCARRFRKEIGMSDHIRDVHGPILLMPALPPIADDPVCLECGAIAKLVGGERIYPHRPDLYHKRFWLCECGAYCGCHGVTTRPLGNPAGPETRRARNAAHQNFDPLWKSRQMDRRAAYAWLSREMGIPPEQTHIGMMTAAQAWQVVDLCNARRRAAA
jgi:hypothetical protein